MGAQQRLAWDLQKPENALQRALGMAGDLIGMLLGIRSRLADDGEMLRFAAGA